MTYETGSAVNLEDLLAKLSTFATTTHGGWTQGYLNTTNGWFELHKSGISVSFKWTKTGTPLHLSVHHALAFTSSGTAPGKHTDDSNNGFNTTDTGHTNANLEGERCVRNIGNGPYPAYHFFADDVDNDYIHVVLEATSGMFRHFGFGMLDKFGNNWTGGQYAYGHFHDTATNATAVDINHQTLLDGLGGNTQRLFTATIHGEGLPNQPALSKWGISAAVPSASALLDQAGNPRFQVHGGFRSGMAARGFGSPIGNFSSGVIPFYSIAAFYRDPGNPRVYLLGYLPDVRALNIRNFDVGQEVVFGTDNWMIFPMSIKTLAAVANRSLFSGIAYRKVP